MKSIKELREQYQVITEKEDKEQRKLTALVRAGLFDAKKLPMLKRALEKGVDKMTPAEKKILIDLLDSLMNQVISNEPIYMKVKRNVQSMDEEIVAEAVKTPVTVSDVPSIVVLKRKAVRVYPGGQQVGLYYSQQLDKYVTIPFGEAGISEEVDLEEAAGVVLRGLGIAGSATIKYGKSLGKKALEKFKNLRKGKKPSGPSNRGGKGGKTKAAAAGAAGGAAADAVTDFFNSGGSDQNKSTYRTPVTYEKRPGAQTSIVAPQYRSDSNAPVDPATARRLQKQFYSQPQQQQRESVNVNLNGNLFEINNDIADKLVDVYESLNENNKQKMIDMLMNEETQNKIVEFVRRY